MIAPLAYAQDRALRALVAHGGRWHLGCGWRYSSPRGTEKVFAALVPAGLVEVFAGDPPVYTATPAGRAYVETTGGVDADPPERPGFVCAICRQEITSRWGPQHGPGAHVAPVCLSCESRYADRVPAVGAFLDRRKLAQLSAITNALSGEAHCKQWEETHPYETQLSERPGLGDLEPGHDDPRPLVRLRRPAGGPDHDQRRDRP